MKNCGVKTVDVEPRLMIRKLGGKEVSQETRDYTSLFGDDTNEPSSKRRRTQQRKILMKGPLGSGKSRVARKIQRDWIKDILVTFSVVFLISVKLVNPGEAIENVIVQQYCLSKDDKHKVLDLLQNPNRKCCIILDAVETTSDFNQIALNILKDSRLSCCDVVCVSDMVSQDIFHKYFDTICDVEGFKGSEFRNLVGSIVSDEKTIPKILDCEVVGPSTVDATLCKTPLVITLQGILAETGELNLKSKRVTLAEIYSKFITYVCRACTETVPDVMKQVGTLAFEVLTSRRILRHKEHDVQSLGEGVFNQGLLVAHGNGLVTFAHRNLEIFLAAFYFVQAFNTACSLELPDLCFSFLTMDPFFLYFCLSLAKSQRGEAYKKLIDAVVKKLDFKQFDFREIAASYPALSYSLAYNKKDELLLDFLDQVLSQCKETKVLYLNPNLPIQDLLSSGKLDSFSKSVSTWILTDGDRSLDSDLLQKALADDLSVIIHDQRQKCIEELISYVGRLNRPYSVFVLLGHQSRKMINCSELASRDVRKISILHEQVGNCKLLAKDIEYPKLTHLSISRIKVDKQFLKSLNESTAKGKLPSIQNLTISGGSVYENFGCAFEYIV